MDAATIVSIETTQALQTFPPSVPLVAKRATTVRLMVRHNLGPSAKPLGRARMRVISQSGSPSSWFDAANGTSPPTANPGLRLPLKDAPDRQVTDDSFNFRVPAALCTGTVQWEFEVRVDAKSVPEAQRGANLRLNQRSLPMEFRSRRRLGFRYVRVLWPLPDPSGSGTIDSLPTDKMCVDAIMDASQLIPMETPLVLPTLTVLIADLSQSSIVWDLLVRLAASRDEIDPNASSIYGPSVDEIWCAIFNFSDFAVQGMSAVGGVNLVAHADRIPIAHETGHCLNQRHLLANCPLQDFPADAEEPWQFSGGPEIADTPFDVARNAVVDHTNGSSYWDMMTYCGGTRWVSRERWLRLWVQVGKP